MVSAAAYRSPLSILRSASLNDDEDLVLRDDHQRNIDHDRRSEQATASSTAAAVSPITPVTASSSSRIGTANNIYRSRPVTNLKSYVPFNIFGMKSPIASSSNANNDPTPPRGAFPPRIIEEESRYAPSRIDETINSDGGGGGGLGGVDEFHGSGYEPSHPWFNRYSSEFDNNENNDNNFNSSSNNNNNNKSYMANNRNQPMDGRPSHFEYMVSKKKERESQKERRAIMSTTFNFTNSIIGAGAMGLGGAFAASGGGISIIILVGFAYLTKRSLDLIVDLSSCPLVINLARQSKDSGRDRTGEESDSDDKGGMSDHPSTVAPTINDFLKQDSEYLQNRRVTEDVDLDTHQEVEVAEDEEKKESSHLITQEEEINVIDVENDSHPQTDTPGLTKDLDSTRFDDDCDVDSNMQTPLKISDLFADHPIPTLNESNLLMKDEAIEPISLLHIDEASSSATTTPIVDEEHHLQPCTYEELGYAAFGSNGRSAVLVSKSLYSFGCLIAYVVVVRDNFGLALRRIVIGPTAIGAKGWIYDDNFLAFWISAIFMLPLSCPRTMESLTKFSFLSILSIVFLTFAIVYMYFSCTNPRGSGDESSFYENWLVIRSFSGLIESLGCFVFTFVCHHTVHLAYESLPLQSRSPKTWRQVSTNSIAMALETSLAIGVFAYLTFGSTTPSDVLTGYPADIALANVARLLLCMNMVLTFPLPFLTCRELIILLLTDMHGFYHRHDLERFNICITMWKHVNHHLHRCTVGISKPRRNTALEGAAENFVQMKRRSFFERWTRKSSYGDGLGASGEWLYDMHGDGEGPTEALLREESESDDDAIGSIGGERGMPLNPSPLSSRSGESSSDESTVSCTFVPTPSWIIPDCNGRQLTFFWHAVLTFILWLLVTISAIKSPSLIDVLDLVGAFTGTMIAFIFPAVFSLKLKGYSKISIIILGIGGTIGMLGTSFSLVKFLRDSI